MWEALSEPAALPASAAVRPEWVEPCQPTLGAGRGEKGEEMEVLAAANWSLSATGKFYHCLLFDFAAM